MPRSPEQQLRDQYENRAAVLGAVTGFALVLMAGPPPVGDWMQSGKSWLQLALIASCIGALIGKLFFDLLIYTQLYCMPAPPPSLAACDDDRTEPESFGLGADD
ncbi:MAG: hypothetical protein MUE46_15055 [Xanthomonadales bacterium]|jgi:membrane protein YqaA with SNARE-associated domain|nr:hypothetical protein [Xanthomonadales bacterium]